MSRVFIIDTENTNDLKFLDKFKVNHLDSIYFLFNKNSKKLEWNSVRDLIYVNCNIDFIELKATGLPNGLDFQISSFLGTLLEKLNNVVDSYYIVSKDKGFLANKGIINELYSDVIFEVVNPETCEFLGHVDESEFTGLSLADLEYVPSTVPNIGMNVKKKVREEMENILQSYLKGAFSIQAIDKSIDMFFKTSSLREFHNRLTTMISQNIGNDCYRCLKGFFGKSIEEMRHHASSNPISKILKVDVNLNEAS